MTDKLLAIISTAEAEKARTGAMYAVNALKFGWMEEVKLFFFGPAQELLLKDEPLQQLVKEYQSMEETAIACKYIADGNDSSEKTSELGIKVDYVGKAISDLIKEGYAPMVW